MLEKVRDAAAARRDVATLQVGDEGRRAAIGHGLERHADRLPGHDAEEMREGAHRRRAEAGARRIFLQPLDVVLERVDADGG